MALGSPLRKAFFARDVLDVAPTLIGCRLVHRPARGPRRMLRITEVEAYLGDGSDPSAHSHHGPTRRNRSMFGPVGRLYAYRSYGIHVCLNIVCGQPEQGACAVLLRAGEPLEGLDAMRRDRKPDDAHEDDPRPRLRDLARGPGRLAQALSVGLESDGLSLLRGPLTLHGPSRSETAPGPAIDRGPRVGISKATDLPYRFFEIQDGRPSPWVSSFRPGRRKSFGRDGRREHTPT